MTTPEELEDRPALTWGTWGDADKSEPYPREVLVDRDVLVKLIRESGVRVCGNCHQHDDEGYAPFVDGVGIALSMRQWGSVMYEVEHPGEEQDWDNMGYCQWAWGNAKCQKCGKDRS